MDSGSESAPLFPSHIWHHRVHSELGESLYFWRLGFSPVYLRDSARAGLKAALAESKVRSVAVYELLGVYDLLIRIWLPEGISPVEFQDGLIRELKPHGLEMCEPFAVDYPVRHWAFGKGERPGEPHILAVKRLIREPERIRQLEAGTLPAAEVKQLCKDNLVAMPRYPNPDLPGIKFAVVVSGESPGRLGDQLGDTGRTLSFQDREALEERVVQVVDAAGDIRERSLYSGSGFGHFVVLGRVDYERFHDLQAKLVAQFGAAPIRERFHVSSVTLLSGQRGLRLFSESLIDSPFVALTPGRVVITNATTWENLTPGSRFAERFEIVESLGKGGFGAVYRAKDHREGGVERAIKLFPPGGGESAQRELSMLRKVIDPHVVTMFWGDRDRETGCWYLVSELVQGTSLAAFIRGTKEGELSDAQSVEIVRQVLAGLEAVHPREGRLAELARTSEQRDLSRLEWDEWQNLKDKAIVHRDIKPENVMIADSGIVKLIDFNIASPAGTLMKTNSQTDRYVPPQGWPERVWKPQVDLFATGVVLYELLSHGEHPYPDGVPPLVPPEKHRPDLSEAQLEVIRRSCSVDRLYVTAESMRNALEKAWRAD